MATLKSQLTVCAGSHREPQHASMVVSFQASLPRILVNCEPTQPQRNLMPTVANYVVIEDDGIPLFTISNLAAIYKTSV
jgi:hypothetical protein